MLYIKYTYNKGGFEMCEQELKIKIKSGFLNDFNVMTKIQESAIYLRPTWKDDRVIISQLPACEFELWLAGQPQGLLK